MYRHVKNLQFEVKVDKPDALFAMKVQELMRLSDDLDALCGQVAANGRAAFAL